MGDELWETAKAKAAAEGTNLTAVIVAALEAYTAGESVGEQLGRGAGAVSTETGLRLEFLGDGAVRLSTEFESLVLTGAQAGFVEQLFTRRGRG
ncbi:MAG: hypothetical protein KC544_14020 [Gemmatimonadetes bacterium]|nr:hypothetical protein [Gemmatimonadota bacterium]